MPHHDPPQSAQPFQLRLNGSVLGSLQTREMDLIVELNAADSLKAFNPRAALLLHLNMQEAMVLLEPWEARLHPDDFGVLSACLQHLSVPGERTGLAPFRVRGQQRTWPWLEGFRVDLLHDPKVGECMWWQKSLRTE